MEFIREIITHVILSILVQRWIHSSLLPCSLEDNIYPSLMSKLFHAFSAPSWFFTRGWDGSAHILRSSTISISSSFWHFIYLEFLVLKMSTLKAGGPSRWLKVTSPQQELEVGTFRVPYLLVCLNFQFYTHISLREIDTDQIEYCTI